VQISAYAVDAELLFTTDPFGQVALATGGGGSGGSGGGGGSGGQQLGRLAYVAPTAVATVDLLSHVEPTGGGDESAAAERGQAQQRQEMRGAAVRLEEVLVGLGDGSSLLLEVSGGGLKRTIHR